MKKIILLLVLFLSTIIVAQNKMITGYGIITFEASVPLFEEVKASNETAQCALNTKTGEIYNTAFIKDFHFKIALMEKHFNEYYLESERYPKAVFKGRIIGFNWYIVGTTPKEFKMKGKLEIHGKKKDIDTLVLLRKVDNTLEINSNFTVTTNDFKIKIPTVLSMKIAEKVNINSAYLVK
ncbi:YceI family protein [Flavobacterium cellulosilyticum]|uniref:YceI family protein n=1 Tax=Flavobacterium cellulosilyticum TaxID=2541731 RepID=A0A4R5CED8_9FLAO|nr:YceI family protein [Flavobacterium cellulosilyticum]TDD97339.1 YceI family protein [Flavobacterium cellulosilyticum]